MKKLSLLVGTLSGAMAGYLLSNKKLRDELSKTKDTEEAAKLLGTYIQKDGKKLAKQAREFIESEEVQSNVTKAKQYANDKMKEAKHELDSMVDTGASKAKTQVKKSASNAKKAVKKKVGSAKKSPTTRKKAAVSKKKTSGGSSGRTKKSPRMRTNTRKIA